MRGKREAIMSGQWPIMIGRRNGTLSSPKARSPRAESLA
jgi:hypothetical protein